MFGSGDRMGSGGWGGYGGGWNGYGGGWGYGGGGWGYGRGYNYQNQRGGYWGVRGRGRGQPSANHTAWTSTQPHLPPQPHPQPEPEPEPEEVEEEEEELDGSPMEKSYVESKPSEEAVQKMSKAKSVHQKLMEMRQNLKT